MLATIKDMNQKLLQKLQALLNLAGSDVNQHESDLAMQRAVEIATKYGIDLASISPKDQEAMKEEFTRDKVDDEDRKILHGEYCRCILRKFFKIDVVKTYNSNNEAVFHFIGRKSDVEFSKFLYGYLIQEFVRRWKQYLKVYNPVKRDYTEKKAFFFGVLCGLLDKLQEAKNKAESEGLVEVAATKHLDAGDLEKSYELMIVSESEALQSAVSTYFPKIKPGKNFRRPVQNDATRNRALNSGYQEGQKINIPGAPLTA